MSGFTSDGASAMMGKYEGVATKVKEKKQKIITFNCLNHGIALAAKKTFEGLTRFVKLDELLTSTYKYYKKSSTRTNNLVNVQTIFRKGLNTTIKRVGFTRCLSYSNAINSVRVNYEAILSDLENAVVVGESSALCGPTASGLLKHLKSYEFFQHYHLARQTSFQASCVKDISEEETENEKHERPILNLKVSGDGTWKKRGFKSTYGVTTLIGYYCEVPASAPTTTSLKNKEKRKLHEEWNIVLDNLESTADSKLNLVLDEKSNWGMWSKCCTKYASELGVVTCFVKDHKNFNPPSRKREAVNKHFSSNAHKSCYFKSKEPVSRDSGLHVQEELQKT
ncbi:hypothetical protein JTE90_014203 [Oedothorax gibbosus]|uniref:Transposase n=1 Tax=Oedothorax gibbosus TaxID=931172 RepID=A0AAV6U286_9ARAC|nr:hypothetical protein JTE90_014203 [Oedothorax gibbosus]